MLLLSLTSFLHVSYLFVEALQGLLVDLADGVERVGSLVHAVVVHCEWALRAHELRHRRVVVVADSLAVESELDVRKLVQNASGCLFRVLTDGVLNVLPQVNFQTLVLHTVTPDLDRLVKEFFVDLILLLGDVELSEADRPGLHGGGERVRLVAADPHHRLVHGAEGLLGNGF